MKKKILLLISIALVLSSFAVPSDIWEVLEEIKFKIYFDETLEDVVFQPIPNEQIKNLDGKIIELRGFVVSDFKGGITLSRYSTNPYNSCTGPPEGSVMAIKSKNKSIKVSEKPCTLKGRFELNVTNYMELYYILHEVECLDCE